ncbi:GDP-fucose protein O-fucosyltransferase [Cynara cardunculus var. scolymus]|uniref:O-fucosyltransferase family protein n=1 Tax=Cynara cardunculus var. scolymus TaxID=59895 RepID=A0A103YFM6_CYNCS|nr:GDP-fucose protein O-fucosyltransferase [Cynara cardunculus var. scolymus]
MFFFILYGLISLLAPSPNHLHHLVRRTSFDDNGVGDDSPRVTSLFKVSISGGSKMITDAVVAARILNATLVVPKLDQKSFWKDARLIFDVDWFISHLSRDVKIIKELPRKGGKIWTPYNMRVPRKCNVICYQLRVLPVLLKKHVFFSEVHFLHYHSSNSLGSFFII